jgi:hypothetical protein
MTERTARRPKNLGDREWSSFDKLRLRMSGLPQSIFTKIRNEILINR